MVRWFFPLLLVVLLTGLGGGRPRAEPRPLASAPSPAGTAPSPTRTAPSPAREALKPGRGVPALRPAQGDTLARLDFLCERLDARQRNLQLWWGIWVGVHTTMGVAQALLAGLSDRLFQSPQRARAYRNSLGTGAITSGVGLVAVLASYPAGASGCGSARRARNGTGPDEERALALAEKRLRDTAKGLRFGRSWLTHAGGVLVNLAAGLVLWLAFDQPVDGAVQLLAGTAVAELQVWTQPTAAIRDYDEYLRRFPTLVPAAHQLPSPGPGWRLVPYPGGLGLQVTY